MNTANEAAIIMAEMRSLASKIAYHENAISKARSHKAKAEARHAELTDKYQALTRPEARTAQEIAEASADAYKADCYGEAEWVNCARELLSRGLTDLEVEAFLRSKHMRWAEDFSGECTVKGLRSYLAKNYFPSGLKSAAEALAADTF